MQITVRRSIIINQQIVTLTTIKCILFAVSLLVLPAAVALMPGDWQIILLKINILAPLLIAILSVRARLRFPFEYFYAVPLTIEDKLTVHRVYMLTRPVFGIVLGASIIDFVCRMAAGLTLTSVAGLLADVLWYVAIWMATYYLPYLKHPTTRRRLGRLSYIPVLAQLTLTISGVSLVIFAIGSGNLAAISLSKLLLSVGLNDGAIATQTVIFLQLLRIIISIAVFSVSYYLASTPFNTVKKFSTRPHLARLRLVHLKGRSIAIFWMQAYSAFRSYEFLRTLAVLPIICALGISFLYRPGSAVWDSIGLLIPVVWCFAPMCASAFVGINGKRIFALKVNLLHPAELCWVWVIGTFLLGMAISLYLGAFGTILCVLNGGNVGAVVIAYVKETLLGVFGFIPGICISIWLALRVPLVEIEFGRIVYLRGGLVRIFWSGLLVIFLSVLTMVAMFWMWSHGFIFSFAIIFSLELVICVTFMSRISGRTGSAVSYATNFISMHK